MTLVERIEEGVAVLEISEENGTVTHRSISLQELGLTVRAGDVLCHTESGWQIDAETTNARRKLAVQRFHRLIHHDH